MVYPAFRGHVEYKIVIIYYTNNSPDYFYPYLPPALMTKKILKRTYRIIIDFLFFASIQQHSLVLTTFKLCFHMKNFSRYLNLGRSINSIKEESLNSRASDKGPPE